MALDERRVSVTPGMARVLRKHEMAYSCKGCDMVIPRYPGRYPAACPSCGGELCSPDKHAGETSRGSMGESVTPVVAVSMVPRLQALIEAGHRWTPTGHDPLVDSPCLTLQFAAVETLMPGGVQGLGWFLEGPVGERPQVFYRVERHTDPVLLFVVSEDTKSVVIQATRAPETRLGFDPRAQFVDEDLREAEVLDSLTKPTAKGVFARHPGVGSGAQRVHGGFRFEIGHNRKRRPRTDITLAIQNRRNSRRGLAGRVRAAKKFHRSITGQSMHKDLARFNRGNHRGESGASLYAALQEELVALPKSFGIPREEMPQIEGSQVGPFLRFLREHGVSVELIPVRVGSVRGTQANVDVDKVAKMVGDLVDAPEDHPLRDPVISSNDGYILDGHHRWAARMCLDPTDAAMETWRVDLPIVELLRLAREFDGATYKAVGEGVDSVPNAQPANPTGPVPNSVPYVSSADERSVDEIFDSILRKLIVIESTDVLEDVEFTEDGAIYLFFDPTLSRPEIDEIMQEIATGEPDLKLIASPDQSLPGETQGCDWWVAFLPRKAAPTQPNPNVYAHTPGAPGQVQPKQQMVVMATTTLDAIAASVDVDAALQAAGKKTENA
jgi:hypothetical protein